MTATLNVLFVCTGNICRSPTAEYVLRSKALRRGWSEERLHIASAGTNPWSRGRGADSRSAAAARARGYDLSPHVARPVEPEDFQLFDYILCMDASNVEIMENIRPRSFSGVLQLFLEFGSDDGPREVPDPYVGEAGFERVLDLIEAASEGFLDSLEPTT